eukprot:4138665-Prymnesium_polylepis.1
MHAGALHQAAACRRDCAAGRRQAPQLGRALGGRAGDRAVGALPRLLAAHPQYLPEGDVDGAVGA